VRAGLGLDALDAPGDAVVVGVDASGWLGALLDDALHSSVDPVPTPDGFEGELRPYQERGVGWLAFLGRVGLGACLADDMGLGKTAQVIASMLSDRVDGPTLVVCPTSVLDNWEREVNRFAPTLSVMVHHGAGRMRDHEELFSERAADHDVVLTSYHLVARDIDVLEAVRWGRFVLDEAQQVKNPYTAQARAVHRLEAPRRIALTGTPVENRLSDLWAIMHTVNPGLLGSARSFKRRFAGPIERDQDAEATDRLQRIVTPFLLRRLKSDRSIIDDLPDKVERTQRCPLTREQATLYQAVVDDLIDQAKGLDGIDRRGAVLAGIMKLKQVCNHPAHFAKDSSTMAGRSGKLARTEELLDQVFAAGDKSLLFTQYSEWGTMLAPYLARRFGIEVPWLHGKLTRKRRDAIVSDFQDADGPPLLVISLKAGGTGLNLTAASHVLHYDRWWNPAVEDQATDRAYRIGQHRNVVVNKLVSSGTVEEKIDEMITSKRALAESVVGAGDGWITELSTDELRDLLTLRTDMIED
jgi:SNF2 family DNA or RNA helicase